MADSNIEALIQQAADQYGLPQQLFRAQLGAESNFNPNLVNQNSGAAGIAQFMPATAAGFGIDPMDPTQAIPAAAAYMRQNLNRFGNDYPTALAAYNWGPGNVATKGLVNMPPETQNYIARILGPGSNPMMLANAGAQARMPNVYQQMPQVAQPPGPPAMASAQGATPPAPPWPAQFGNNSGTSLANVFFNAARATQGPGTA